MPGNAELGAVLRELRKVRHLTLAAVARRADCAESMVSYIESGHRHLHPWLATRLDAIYDTGGVITALTCTSRSATTDHSLAAHSDTLVVEVLEGGAAMPLSRRELLLYLGIGIGGGELLSNLYKTLDTVEIDDDSLASFEAAYAAYQSFARAMPPAPLIDQMTGKVAVHEGLRRRTHGRQRREFAHMQARFAESLSWLSEESADLTAALYWIDRATQWSNTTNWPEMAAYCTVRRSMIAISFASDGRRAIDLAHDVLDAPDPSPRIAGLAAKQMAFGYALSGDADASMRALDRAMHLLAKPARDSDTHLGQRSVVDDDLFTIFRTTCEIYLGRGERVIPVLEPRLAALSTSSARTATITRAKLARAYANAGLPHESAHIAHTALDDIARVKSLSALSELRRTLPVLRQWHGHQDVQSVIQRLATTA
ncbi:helix-turn-helix domain-containing protein [Nocardia sp. NPDC050175]|uniref:helix-turn-helix domain-containing protein n=1 Tax=Nocardia sp. NPDC050175 TaxID=3364317 RepID=UPI00379AAC30